MHTQLELFPPCDTDIRPAHVAPNLKNTCPRTTAQPDAAVDTVRSYQNVSPVRSVVLGCDLDVAIDQLDTIHSTSQVNSILVF